MLLGLMLLSSCGEKKEQTTKAPIRVKTQVVSAGTSAGSVSYVGIVEESEATAVSFTSMGVVKRVLVSEGQAVTKGQLIAEIDDTQARNVLSGAEAAAAQANDAMTRYSMLHENGSLPEVQWVEVQSKVAQAQAQLEVAKKNLADCRLRAPVSGIVGRKMIAVGETALPSQAIVTILDIQTVKVKVAVPETEMSTILTTTPTTIKVEATGGSYQGGRIEKGVQADALTHTYDVRINVANSERKLLPGMVASVTFLNEKLRMKNEESIIENEESNNEASAVAVPVTAVQKNTDGTMFVWTVGDDNTAHRTAVTIGRTKGNDVEIVSGLDTGMHIVTEGYQKLSEGTHVVY